MLLVLLIWETDKYTGRERGHCRTLVHYPNACHVQGSRRAVQARAVLGIRNLSQLPYVDARDPPTWAIICCCSTQHVPMTLYISVLSHYFFFSKNPIFIIFKVQFVYIIIFHICSIQLVSGQRLVTRVTAFTACVVMASGHAFCCVM